MNKRNDGKSYLYPELEKWINACVVCHVKGYNPAMPEHIGGAFSIAAQNIRQYFKPLAVDELHICEQCAKHFYRTK